MKKNSIKNIMFALMTLLLTNSSVNAATGLISEIKHIGIKFAQMSLGVICSIIVIYICLIGYKNFKNPKIFKNNNLPDNVLNSADSIDDAIEHFIKDSE